MIAFQGIFDDLKEEIALSLLYALEEMLNCKIPTHECRRISVEGETNTNHRISGRLPGGGALRGLCLKPGQFVPVVILRKTVHSWEMVKGQARHGWE